MFCKKKKKKKRKEKEMQPYLTNSTKVLGNTHLCKAMVIHFRNRPHMEQNVTETGGILL